MKNEVSGVSEYGWISLPTFMRFLWDPILSHWYWLGNYIDLVFMVVYNYSPKLEESLHRIKWPTIVGFFKWRWPSTGHKRHVKTSPNKKWIPGSSGRDLCFWEGVLSDLVRWWKVTYSWVIKRSLERSGLKTKTRSASESDIKKQRPQRTYIHSSRTCRTKNWTPKTTFSRNQKKGDKNKRKTHKTQSTPWVYW